ncbi:MAG: hypothetical protein Q7K44_02020 [Candidatus Liptonbacteria bacterium]|nr:hypothetical protein [Candidatus Liptonbacteria bacterium]
MKTKYIAYAGTVVLSLASLALFAAADENGEKQLKEARSVGSTLEIHITDNGKTLIRGAKVTSVSGNTINASATWGSVVFNWAVVTDSSTEFIRRYGSASKISEISIGDFISFQGALDTTVGSPVTVKARIIKDWSIQKKHASFYGLVKSTDTSAKGFILTSEDKGDISVKVSDTAKITKGNVAGVFADITVGAKVTASGLYNTESKILEADTVKIHLPTAIRTTLEGKIKSITGTAPPTTLVVTSKDKDYTVNVSVDTSVLNALWLASNLSAYHVGDGARVYGTVNADLTVDATVIRNVNIR